MKPRKTAIAVRMFTPNDTLTAIYTSMYGVRRDHGIPLPTIIRSIADGRPVTRGKYKGWRFEVLPRRSAA